MTLVVVPPCSDSVEHSIGPRAFNAHAELGTSAEDEAAELAALADPEERIGRTKVTVRILGTPGPQRRRHRTSQLICDLRPSLDIRGFRSEPWARRLPDGSLVDITSTPCHFGGARWWLICPRCQRRCTVLYGLSCRLCQGAVHETTILSPEDRLREKALKIRRRLGQTSGGLLAPFLPRPKHMRWATYMRLRRECQDAEQAVIRTMAKAIGLTLPSEEPEELFIPDETFHEKP